MGGRGISPFWNSIVLHPNVLHQLLRPRGSDTPHLWWTTETTLSHVGIVVGPTAGGHRSLPLLDY
jgi:hypothetical protein